LEVLRFEDWKFEGLEVWKFDGLKVDGLEVWIVGWFEKVC
jgi:hypothetical protein